MPTALALTDRVVQCLPMGRWTTIARTLLALLSVTALAGCGGAPAVETSPTAAPTVTTATSRATAGRGTVTLGIYSGRPDPSWVLTEAQLAQVDAAVAALPVATGTPPEGGLGYHGFTLVLGPSGSADEAVVAYRGTVAPPGTGQRPYRVDAGRTVERLLLDSGRSILAPAEVAVVEADLAAAP